MSILDNIEPRSGRSTPGDQNSGSAPPPALDGELVGIRDLVESLEQVLFLVSSDWNRAYYVSPAYERVTGYSRESLFTNLRGWTQLVHPETTGLSFARRWETGPLAGSTAAWRWNTEL